MALSRRVLVPAAVVAGLAIVMAGLVLRAQQPTLAPPAQAVQDVLELRRERSSDASSYAEYFVSAELAQTLAQDATASASATGAVRPPIPAWERPYVSAQTSATADVVVRWKSDASFPDWANATVFELKLLSDSWKIVDAQELTGTAPPELR